VEALNPDNAWLYYYRATIYIEMGGRDKAMTDLRLFLQLDDPPLIQKKIRADTLLH
jgi:tetratricopeptide (TPR) repeat protein